MGSKKRKATSDEDAPSEAPAKKSSAKKAPAPDAPAESPRLTGFAAKQYARKGPGTS